MIWKCSKITKTLKLFSQFQKFFHYYNSNCLCLNIGCSLSIFHTGKKLWFWDYFFQFCTIMHQKYPLFAVGYKVSFFCKSHYNSFRIFSNNIIRQRKNIVLYNNMNLFLIFSEFLELFIFIIIYLLTQFYSNFVCRHAIISVELFQLILHAIVSIYFNFRRLMMLIKVRLKLEINFMN